jgi:hypothetical protein
MATYDKEKPLTELAKDFFNVLKERVVSKATHPLLEDFGEELQEWVKNVKNTRQVSNIVTLWISTMSLRLSEPDEDEEPDEDNYTIDQCRRIIGIDETIYASGSTVLHVLAICDEPDWFNVMVSWGANIFTKNEKQFSPKDMIERKGYTILSSGEFKGYIDL